MVIGYFIIKDINKLSLVLRNYKLSSELEFYKSYEMKNFKLFINKDDDDGEYYDEYCECYTDCASCTLYEKCKCYKKISLRKSKLERLLR